MKRTTLFTEGMGPLQSYFPTSEKQGYDMLSSMSTKSLSTHLALKQIQGIGESKSG